MLAFRRLHDLDQNAAHILGVDEEHQRAVRADAGLAEHARALGLELGLGGVDLGHFEADMMLPAERVLLEELAIGLSAPSGSISSIWLLGVSTKHTRTPCGGRSNGSWILVAPSRSR